MGVAATYVKPVLIASGTTWAQFLAGGLAAILDNLIAQNPAVGAPSTQLTAAPTGGGASGGLLAAGVYYASYTNVGPAGESPAGGESASFTVGATNIPRITFPALPTGVTCRNLYLTAAGGATGSEVLYQTGVTGTTLDLAVAGYVDALRTPPGADGSALSVVAPYLNGARNGFPERLYQATTELFNNYLHGNPIALAEAMLKLQHRVTAHLAIETAVNEAATLIYANTGTLTTAAVGNAGVNAIGVRTFS